MLLQSFEHLLFKTVGLTTAIWASEKTNLLEMFFNPNEQPEVMALKMSAFLSGTEYVSDMVLSRTIGVTTPSLYSNLSSLGYAFVTNTLVLYAFDKLRLDEKIINQNSSDETKAFQMAILFILVQEISHFVLSYVLKQYF